MTVPKPIPSTALETLLERRSTTNFFDADHVIPDAEISRLASLATRAPSAFNLQNWRLDAVRRDTMKQKLCAAAFGQAKVAHASVTFVISGELGSADPLAERLAPAVESGIMDASLVTTWVAMAAQNFALPLRARDEAIRSASLLASTLMLAAEARGWSTAPMSGFHPQEVADLLTLPRNLVPVLLLAIGKSAPGNLPQKPRRDLAEVLRLH